MKQKILVAGGTGYIGSHTTVELQNAGYEVVIIDDLSNSNIEVLDGIERITGIRPEFIKLDLKDKEGTREALKAHPGIKGIILFAASKAVGESVQQPLKYYRNNVVTLVNLLELMPEFNIEGIVFSSYSFLRKLASAVSGSLSRFVLGFIVYKVAEGAV